MRTVTVWDPDTHTSFQATRIQWERLHKPEGRTLIADENGVSQQAPKKTTKKSDPATTEE